MNISVLCTNAQHPVMTYLKGWQSEMVLAGHNVSLATSSIDIDHGDVLFLVSCTEIVDYHLRDRFRYSFVLHASNLPAGRGWSPYIWDVLNGSDQLTVCLLEAASPVDSGRIWLKKRIALAGYELLPEIHDKLFQAETELMSQVISAYESIEPVMQDETLATYYPKRSPADSRIDPEKSIAQQFDLLRVVDSERYPAFFEFRGKRFKLKIEKYD
jgi:methionyl-tRNA formyltransferase